MEDSENNHQQIIELHSVETDKGEIRYTAQKPPKKNPNSLNGLVKGVLGIAIGVAVFLLLVTFFVYVIIPLILIIILWSFLSRLLSSRR